MSETTITFLSDACTDHFTENTISSFRNKLSYPITLDHGEWEIALASVSYIGGTPSLNDVKDVVLFTTILQDGWVKQARMGYPTGIKYYDIKTLTTELLDVEIEISPEGFCKIRRKDHIIYYRFRKKVEFLLGIWESVGEGKRLYDARISSKGVINDETRKKLFEKEPEWVKKGVFATCDWDHNKIMEVLVKRITKENGKITKIGQVDYSEFLRELNLSNDDVVIKYDDALCFEVMKGMHLYDPRMGYHNLLIYCDLIPPQYVGGTMAPLLKVLPFEKGRVTEFFPTPVYYKLNKDFIDDFHIYIRCENGKVPPFQFGTFSGTLSLRKRES